MALIFIKQIISNIISKIISNFFAGRKGFIVIYSTSGLDRVQTGMTAYCSTSFCSKKNERLEVEFTQKRPKPHCSRTVRNHSVPFRCTDELVLKTER